VGDDLHRDLRISLRDNTKSIWVNSKREQLARYLGLLQVFAFTADQLEVVRGMPEARRHFIDRGVASLRPAYVQTVSDYNKVIKQKNRILQDASERELRLAETENLIAPWNEQLRRLGAEIHNARVDYTERLNGALERTLFEPAELQIRYVSSLESKGDLSDYEALLGQRLELRLPAEVSSGRALIGPHRDDLGIHLGGREMRTYGSSGQQRSALLLLDLAAISVYNSSHNDYPIFLVDDVDAELDEKRIRRLLEYLEGRTQTFITTSKRSHLEGFLSRANVQEIVQGKAASQGLNRSAFSAAATAVETVPEIPS
jgi:DNA replication and repair protein RecF